MLHDKHMIVFGGISEVTKELDDLFCLDIDKKKWNMFQGGKQAEKTINRIKTQLLTRENSRSIMTKTP
jgi:hypothetical protein